MVLKTLEQVDSGFGRFPSGIAVHNPAGETLGCAGVLKTAGTVRAVGIHRTEHDPPASGDADRRRDTVLLIAPADAACISDGHEDRKSTRLNSSH